MCPPRRVRDLNQVLTLGMELKRGVSFPNPTHAGCNSEKRAVLQNSSTPSLRSHEIEDDDEDSLSDVAFCAHWLAVLSASEVGRTKRLVRAHLSCNSNPGLKPWAKFYCPLRGKDDLPFRTITSALTTKRYIKKLHNDSRRWTAATRLRLAYGIMRVD